MAYPRLTEQQRRNRQLLKTLMEEHGFANCRKGRWHNTLESEPDPGAHLDFPKK
ncbi:MAG: hypothetical protein OXH06_17675 [Gemmatimonadetes bacterium]|nr:hypothetical protein [Gemmatimonadota bacterium]